ncbi:Small subunit (SSU) processome component [Varicellaria rhodocarpa]|nr:Small subunit (SSU) processome component [Varicellaria rhodocarpa]
MVRKLKHHEQKLLRKVDFTTYKSDNGHRDALVLRRYAIQKPSDYTKYNRICGSLRQLAHLLANLESSDPFRRKHEALLLEKCYDMGFLGSSSGGRGKLSEVERKITVSCTEVMIDPAFLVSRNMEDFITWVDSSKIKRNILKYRDKLDDFDLL